MLQRKRQQGFTLVEIAIVMVIIGLLLGGALKGQEMITNAKNKRIKADFDQISAAMYSYQDIYRALPGDNDAVIAQHGLAADDEGDGNGLIDSNDESGLFWQHLRAAGLIAGANDDTDSPQNSFSGRIAVQTDIVGLNGVVVCFTGVPEASMQLIDIAYDDGTANTGNVRATDDLVVGTNGTAAIEGVDADADFTGARSICLGT